MNEIFEEIDFNYISTNQDNRGFIKELKKTISI